MQEDADMRYSKKRQQEGQRWEVEDEQVRESRIKQMTEYVHTACSKETPESREARLQQKRKHAHAT